MRKYQVKIDPEALKDLWEITVWYNEKQSGLGKRFKLAAIKHINSLSKNPQLYAVRYEEIRCMVVKKFPYLVHFYINDENHTVEVLAVISTDRDPKIWTEKTGKP
jgi:plasmid stabilization system protein ParE